jgi:hypothetical protein
MSMKRQKTLTRGSEYEAAGRSLKKVKEKKGLIKRIIMKKRFVGIFSGLVSLTLMSF